MLVCSTSIYDLNVVVVVPTTEQQLSRTPMRDAKPVVVVPTTEQHDSSKLILVDNCAVLVCSTSI